MSSAREEVEEVEELIDKTEIKCKFKRKRLFEVNMGQDRDPE